MSMALDSAVDAENSSFPFKHPVEDQILPSVALAVGKTSGRELEGRRHGGARLREEGGREVSVGSIKGGACVAHLGIASSL